MKKNYKFKLAASTWDKKELNAINQVIKSGNYSMGKYVKKYEEKFAEFFESKYSVMVNSGSSANLLMIAALFFKKKNKLKRGDEVIVPAVSWSTTYAPLQQYGLNLKFIDIDIDSLNYDLNILEKSITKKTKAILLVNLLGNPNDFLKIKKMIRSKNIILLEDNCESMGATYNKKYTGTFGLMGTFSSFFSHHISTMEGGMVLTNNKELYHILLSLRAHGWTRNIPQPSSLVKKNNDNFFESFRFIFPGYNVRPLEFEGAIGLEQLKKLPGFIRVRKQNAKYFISRLSKFHEKIYIQKEIGESSWFGFTLIIKPNLKIKRKVLHSLLEKSGIESRPIVTGNFAKSESLKYYNFKIPSPLINAEILDKYGLFIGNNHFNQNKMIDKLCEIIGKL
jgi:CDP-4-dehydro-6-deoxyglucose reductase, E1